MHLYYIQESDKIMWTPIIIAVDVICVGEKTNSVIVM